MNVSEQTKNDVMLLGPQGRLDGNTSVDFEQLVMARIAAGSKRLVIDFSDLDYVSSAGLRVLLMTAKRLKADSGKLALCGLKEPIREVF
jgi:anti-anti-sigma factor